MNAAPDNLAALLNHIESAMEELNQAAISADDLNLEEIGPWLEWIGEELDDLLRNVLSVQLPDGSRVTRKKER